MNPSVLAIKSPISYTIPTIFSRITIPTVALVGLVFNLSGCSGLTPANQMPTLIDSDPNPQKALQETVSQSSQQKLEVGLALVNDVAPSNPPTALSEDALAQFTVRTKTELENTIPLDIQEVVRLDTFQAGKGLEPLTTQSKDEKLSLVILVLTSSEEVKTPAYLDASSPDVGILPGNEIQNYALVELALVDLQTGKSLVQAHGRSYALLEQLDVPIESNRYPLVTGSAGTNRFYPKDDKALEVLRTVAMEEALDQAIMQFDSEWRETLKGSARRQSEVNSSG